MKAKTTQMDRAAAHKGFATGCRRDMCERAAQHQCWKQQQQQQQKQNRSSSNGESVMENRWQ
jgi:hypothetical protein